MYEELNLKAWPFQSVPDPDFAKIWAGRSQTKRLVDLLLRRMQVAPKSSLHLFWANFGMGKTHTLLHLKHLSDQTKGILIPVYAVMPNKASNFVDIYREIVGGLPFDYLGEQLTKVGNSYSGGIATHPMFLRSPGVVNALLALRRGDVETSSIAIQWLSAQTGLRDSDRRKIGVTYTIKRAEDAIYSLTALTKLAAYKAHPNTKLVIFIDEYQRIGELNSPKRSEINAGIHNYFNANSNGLELFLTFSFGRQENITYLLSNELRSRADPQSISLDVLKREEAIDFLRDLLAQLRIRPDDQWAYPFSPRAIEILVGYIFQRKTLTPRRIMLYANHVLSSYMSDHLDVKYPLTENGIRRYLNDDQLSAIDVDDDNPLA